MQWRYRGLYPASIRRVIMFILSAAPIDVTALTSEIAVPEMGAIVTFQGCVRNHNHSREVTSLEYEAYEALAVSEAHRIIESIKLRLPILDVRSAHRIGHLNIGEVAVCIVVTAAHREAAFQGCKALIDAFKQHLPIWKREHYSESDARWISCTGCAAHAHVTFDEHHYYSRQANLPNLGHKGQQKLKEARVLVVGAGGLGCPVLSYLTGAGIGNVGICDDDRLDTSNLHRQVLYSYTDIGQLKVELAKRRLSELNPFVAITCHTNRIDTTNVEEIIASYDLVLDCTDCIKTKFILHDACFLKKIPLIQAGVHQYDGQIQLFKPGSSSGCLRCLFPQMPPTMCLNSCQEAGILGAVPGVIGALQAVNAVRFLLGEGDPSNDAMTLFNAASSGTTSIKRPRNPMCSLCGLDPTIDGIDESNYTDQQSESYEVDISDESAAILQEYQLLDIREAQERNLANPWEAMLHHFPNKDTSSFFLLPKNKKYLLICAKGRRSLSLTTALREQGLNNVYSLRGGIESFDLVARRTAAQR